MLRSIKDKIKKLYDNAKITWLWKLKSKRKNVSYMGNLYGGYGIYQMFPQDRKTLIYSFGIGEDISFEKACMEQLDAEIYAFDPTPKSVQWMEGQKLGSSIKFYPYGLAVKDGSLSFYLPKNEQHVSGSLLKNEVCSDKKIVVPVKSLESVMKELGHHSIDILKMDIEGMEYEVIADLLKKQIPVNQICFESHHKILEHGKTKLSDLKKLLKEHGYVHFYTSWIGDEFGYKKS